MDKELLVFSDGWLVLGWIGVLILLWRTWRSGDLVCLKEPSRLNLFLGASVTLMVIWQIRTGIRPGLTFHLLGASIAVLMFGLWRGWLATGIAATATALVGNKTSLSYLGMEVIMFSVVPAAFTHFLFRLVDKKLPNHFFIYVLVNGFFGAAMAIGFTGLVATLIMSWSGAYQLDYLLEHYTPYYFLLAWSEAFMTGMMVTLMAVYKPEWLETFDDARYIQNK